MCLKNVGCVVKGRRVVDMIAIVLPHDSVYVLVLCVFVHTCMCDVCVLYKTYDHAELTVSLCSH